MYSLKGLAAWSLAARAAGIADAEIDTFVNGSTFATLVRDCLCVEGGRARLARGPPACRPSAACGPSTRSTTQFARPPHAHPDQRQL